MDNSAALIADSNADDNNLNEIHSKDHSLLAKSERLQKPWQKCAALKESPSDITTQEEYYKFDFQVRPFTIHHSHSMEQINVTFFSAFIL